MITSLLLILLAIAVALTLLAALGYLAQRLIAHRHADFLRECADHMDNGLRPEPLGIRYAADLIDPRTRQRTR